MGWRLILERRMIWPLGTLMFCQPTPTPVPPPTPPVPTPPPSDGCDWHENTGLEGSDMEALLVESKEDCCDACKSTTGCVAADFNNVYKEFGVPHPHGVHLESRYVDLSSAAGYKCHLKKTFQPKVRTDGSVACVPNGALSV